MINVQKLDRTNNHLELSITMTIIFLEVQAKNKEEKSDTEMKGSVSVVQVK